MVTSHRRHAVMVPVGPDLSTPAAMSPVHPWTTNTPSSVMMRNRAGHRTVERADEHGPDQPQKRNESCGKTIQGMKIDPPTVRSRLR